LLKKLNKNLRFSHFAVETFGRRLAFGRRYAEKTYSSPPWSLSRRKPPPIPTKIREKDNKPALRISGFMILYV
jgi:hypothetical protein